jgi:hypothetical protein
MLQLFLLAVIMGLWRSTERAVVEAVILPKKPHYTYMTVEPHYNYMTVELQLGDEGIVLSGF